MKGKEYSILVNLAWNKVNGNWASNSAQNRNYNTYIYIIYELALNISCANHKALLFCFSLFKHDKVEDPGVRPGKWQT